jgi:putative endonuclease
MKTNPPPPPNQALGQNGEQLAADHLQRMGYTILERNYRNRLGEIDIIARHRGRIVFVEVKTRRSQRFGSPKWSVTPAKQRNLTKVALSFLKTRFSIDTPARFDVVSVSMQPDDRQARIEVIANAFEPVLA